jgi:peptide methionine sulfoxide reductase MsrA
MVHLDLLLLGRDLADRASARLSYEELLADFLTARIPARLATGTNSLHPPAIFYHSEEQRQAAGRVRENINRSGNWGAPFIADIQPATEFYPAEEYHQDYFQKNSAVRACGLE